MKIYIIGICGTGTGALAGLLKQQGHQVSGSDAHVYPPMSDKLREWGIALFEGFDKAHLEPRPDLVIVGNVIRVDNPEAMYAQQTKLPTLSMPQAVAQFGIGNKHSVVVAGTHGKTTTSALLTHVLLHAGWDPGYLVGGALVEYPESFRSGKGDVFVVEGDEYDTAYFDKGPKFVHYRPKTAIITSLEFDHADIFADLQAVKAAFAKLVEKVPQDGQIIVWDGAEHAKDVIEKHRKTKDVVVYAAQPGALVDLFAEKHRCDARGIELYPVFKGQSLGMMRVPLWGEFSVCNALSVIAALLGLKMPVDAIRAGLASFQGVKRRMEIRGTPAGVIVVDDFAHHPTAVEVTLAAAKMRWPNQRIWALFEPRSATSRRNVFQKAYAQAFEQADEVIIAGHARLQEIDLAHRFDPKGLVDALEQHHVAAHYIENPDAIATYVAQHARANDVIMVLSNGDFGGLHTKLLSLLAQNKKGPNAIAPSTL